MTRVPMGITAQQGPGLPFGPLMSERYAHGLVPQGISAELIAEKKVREQFARFEDEGYGRYPVCMAKTQYSFSTDPNLLGAPSGHVVPIREVRLAAGAEFIVVICGHIMTMPGLPRVPAANAIRVNSEGRIEGLF